MTDRGCSWLGDDNLPLMDVNTEHPDVISQLEDWIPKYVKEYGIDGLRIDGRSYALYKGLDNS